MHSFTLRLMTLLENLCNSPYAQQKKNNIIDDVPSTKLIRYKYSDIYDMAKDTLEFAKLNLVAMLHAEK